ncbi:MAG TPA: YsnF/AvaK domain-containing protein [Terriglobales bacterium]|nr:YsnF/AvaK domain-containing protein [Terriglobales bacterium]
MADVLTPGMGAVAGLFQNEDRAEKAIKELKKADFSADEIGIATQNSDTGKTEKFWDKVNDTLGKKEHAEQAMELRESLIAGGVTPAQAQYLDSRLAAGGVLITVRADGADRAEARRILESNGADLGIGVQAPPVTEPALNKQTAPAGDRSIQLRGEILRVHKERVGRGEVRLRKETVTENQHVEVPVTHEELVVERTPGSKREVPAGQVAAGEKEIRVPLNEEHVKVEKKPVVNEEVRVGTRQVQTTERVNEPIRHEELRVEGNVPEAEQLKRPAAEAERLKDKERLEAERLEREKGKRIA